ncbi:SAP-like protein BP-73 isoform X2 [Magnolia sinica]|uniref:SAP-like protein BP-73 isoform X2 n=1 Tax=Magnolia sinica TaxID=86752 RepID=UPI00265B1DED|nr:SAP-like protein BP-73 isoform X2 [Magnolia sinica]
MQAILFPNCGLGFPTCPAFKSTLRKSIFSDKDGALFFAARGELIQSSVSSIRPEGNRRRRSPRKNTASDRAAEEDEEEKVPQSPDGDSPESSNQEEIIALFRRIQSSISKGGSGTTKRRSSSSSKEKKSAESVLDVLNQYPSRKQFRDKGPSKEENGMLPRKTPALRKEPITKEDSLKEEFKLSRPPSNFVKRSPIPSPPMLKEKVGEVNEDGLPAVVAVKDSELQRVHGMKLSELKELAKSRGVKGYSKLKKGELVELLKGLLQS